MSKKNKPSNKPPAITMPSSKPASLLQPSRPAAAPTPTPSAHPSASPARLSRSQRLAQQAHERITDLKTHNSALVKEYKSRADGFAVLIMRSGLAQALGFLKAKSMDGNDTLNQAYQRYRDDLARLAHDNGNITGDAFHLEVLSLSLPEYRLATQRTLEAAMALKRMGQALIHEETGASS